MGFAVVRYGRVDSLNFHPHGPKCKITAVCAHPKYIASPSGKYHGHNASGFNHVGSM